MTPSQPTTPSATTRDVNDIPDAELIRRAIASIRRVRKPGCGRPRWESVAFRFALGSTYAHQLCRRFGFDPDEHVVMR